MKQSLLFPGYLTPCLPYPTEHIEPDFHYPKLIQPSHITSPPQNTLSISTNHHHPPASKPALPGKKSKANPPKSLYAPEGTFLKGDLIELDRHRYSSPLPKPIFCFFGGSGGTINCLIASKTSLNWLSYLFSRSFKRRDNSLLVEIICRSFTNALMILGKAGHCPYFP